jgi:hypothetical protein
MVTWCSDSYMIIFDCPNSTKEVVLGSDTTGVYQCPNCNMNIEYLSGNELTVSTHKSSLSDEYFHGRA